MMKVHGIQSFAQKEPLPTEKREEMVDAKKLLDSLREKQALFATLKKEGLINPLNPLKMEAQLAQTIQELEELIPKLETSRDGLPGPRSKSEGFAE